jgi:SET domain-containing protein 6
MKALKPIKAGEEILNDYGPLPRSDLLRRYGYITDNYEKYDVVEVAIDLVCDIIQKDGRYTECAIDTRVSYSPIEVGFQQI